MNGTELSRSSTIFEDLLVRQQEQRITCKRAGNRDVLLLPAGQL